MTNKALQKLLTSNCDKITKLVSEMYDAIDEYGDDELMEITQEWLGLIDECANLGEDTTTTNLYTSLDYLANQEE